MTWHQKSSFNIRSFAECSKFEMFKIQLNSDFDIVGVSKSWLTNALPERFVEIPGFNTYKIQKHFLF